MSSDVFIISAASAADPSDAIRLAVEDAGVNASRLQDAVFGSDGSSSGASPSQIVRAAGLVCGTVVVTPRLRAIFVAAQSILSGDVDLVGVVGLDASISTAFVIASPEAVGKLNIVPRARFAARSLAGSEPAMRQAELTADDVVIFKDGDDVIALVKELIEALEGRQEQWGLVSEDDLSILVERV